MEGRADETVASPTFALGFAVARGHVGLSSGVTRLRITVVDASDGAAVYLIDASGESWRVWDSVGRPAGRRNSTAPPDPMATHRSFVSREGVRRVYEFGRKDSRALVPRLLMAQLAGGTPARRV